MPRKTKTIKKTDIDGKKPWLKKKGISIIEEPSIFPLKTFLIVCEGQTEELYFKSFEINSITVKCMSFGCSNFQLVDCTIELSSGENYDEVWVVFDMDFNPQKGTQQYSEFDNAIQKAKDNNIKVAYSNDAFELWFYLHYQYTDQKNLRFFYYQELGKLWNINYEKEGKSRKFANQIYSILKNDNNASSEKAIIHAKNLFEKNMIFPYHNQNPVTTVYQLFEALTEKKL